VFSVRWESLRNCYVNLNLASVRSVDMENSIVLGCRIDTEVYLGRDQLGNLKENEKVGLKMDIGRK
jgi:hypothetical protein